MGVNNNRRLVLVAGKSAGGKSASLKDFTKPAEVAFFNCENGKELPFKSKFEEFVITDPYQIYQGFEYAESNPKIAITVTDTITYLMDMFETMYVLPSTDSRKMWGEYAQFFKRLMFEHVAKSTKNVIMLAHISDVYNEAEQIMETKVKVKGALMNQGIN